MKKKTEKQVDYYTDEPIGKVKIVKDFLPKPKDLALKNEVTKITLLLNKSSVDFFKREAKKSHAKYQQMIRSLLEQYVNYYAKHG